MNPAASSPGDEAFVVADEHRGVPLDEYISWLWPDVAKGTLRRLVREGLVTVDGRPALPGHSLRSGQVVILEQPLSELGVKRQRRHRLDLEVLYQDEHLLAVNKPAGLPVEPSRWGEHPDHLGGAVLAWAERELAVDGVLEKRPRALHRLDLGTSGVILYALSLDAERHYRRLFEQREVDKVYHALVIGEMRHGGSVDAALEEIQGGKRMQLARKGGKPAYTDYTPLRIFRGFTLVEARPRSGRMHQIRVHLASVGHPLMVDPLYGGRPQVLLSEIKPGYRAKAGRVEKPLLDRLSLHATTIALPAFQGGRVEIEAPYPKDLRVLLAKLEKWRRAPATYTD